MCGETCLVGCKVLYQHYKSIFVHHTTIVVMKHEKTGRAQVYVNSCKLDGPSPISRHLAFFMVCKSAGTIATFAVLSVTPPGQPSDT